MVVAEFWLGYDARLRGLFVKDCPYPANTPKYEAWLQGWTDETMVQMFNDDDNSLSYQPGS